MNEPSLPDLLEALGELFLVPGAFDRPRFEALGRASWVGLGITPALQGLIIEDTTDLNVAYTGLFLQGARGPTLHLQASAQFAGALADPERAADLASIAAVVRIQPDPGVQADHLGAMLVLLAHLLRAVAEVEGKRAACLEGAAADLLQKHLQPLAERVASGLEPADVHPFYRSAGRLLAKSLQLAARVLT